MDKTIVLYKTVDSCMQVQAMVDNPNSLRGMLD